MLTLSGLPIDMSNNISVDHDFNHLSYCTEVPDVTLVIEDTEIPAHRSVLSERCEYFKTMFASSFIEAKSDRVVLKEITLLTFKVILKFIYTGELSTLYHECHVPKCKHDTHSITIDQFFELLQCARYYMVDDLVNDTFSKLKGKCSSNPGLTLHNAYAYSVDELILYSTNFIQKQAHNLAPDQLFEILRCAQYYVIDVLANDTFTRLKWICLSKPSLILSNALAYSVDELVSYSTELIVKNAHNLVENKIFEQLTHPALEHLFKHRLDTYESIIFEALVNWMRNNLDHSEAFPKLLEHIELHLLDKAHLDMLFKPTQLIDPQFFEHLLSQQREQRQKIQKVEDKNIINADDDFRIIDGTKNCIYVRRNTGEATVTPLFPKDSIVIDLKQQFLLNCLKIDSVFSNSYIVSVSKNLRDWECVIDHSKYEGSGPQDLYFEERAFRFIRIQSDAKYFNISTNIEAMYSTDASWFEFVDSGITHSVPNHDVTWSEKFKNLLL